MECVQSDRNGTYDILGTAVVKSGREFIRWLHDSSLTEWQSLLEKTVKLEKGDDKSRHQLVAKLMEVIGTKLTLQPERDAVTGSGEQEEEEEHVDSTEENDWCDYKMKAVRILTVTCNEKFIEAVKTTVAAWSTFPKKHEALGILLTHLQLFCSEVLESMPFLAADALINLVCTAIGAIASSPVLSTKAELLGQFTSLQRKIQDINKSLEESNRRTKKDEFDQHEQLLHCMEPPEDFREIPIIPTLQELISDPKPFLRPNNVIGSYRSADHYLDVHFRLLREDFVRPLRNAVRNFMKNKNEFIRNIGRRRTNREQDSSVRMYTDVAFLHSEKTKDNNNRDENYIFSLPKTLVAKVKWDKSKRLLPGCLVMLTADFGETALFAVTLPPPFDPTKKTTGGIDPRRQELAHGTLRLSIETGKDLVKKGKSYLMFECEAFFEAYRYNLGILQTIRFLENNEDKRNCLNKIIVQASSQIEPPAYLTADKNLQIQVGFKEVLTDDGEQKKEHLPDILTLSPFQPEMWPAKEIQEKLNVDPDQYEALKTALTSELAVIQGPPGTGKTYVGLQIVKTLLSNKANGALPASPFLIVCYTNHALDQFLELLLRELPSLSVVRVGGQSKSEVLKDYTLPQHRRKIRRCSAATVVEQQKEMEVFSRERLTGLEQLHADLISENAALSNPNGIFDFRTMHVQTRLKKALPPSLWLSLKDCAWLDLWPDTFLFPYFHVKEIVSQLFVVKPKSTATTSKSQNRVETFVENGGEMNSTVPEWKEKEEFSEYNMDELLEHRLLEGEDFWDSTYSRCKARSADARTTKFYLDTYCAQSCRSMTVHIDDLLKKEHKEYTSLMRNNESTLPNGIFRMRDVYDRVMRLRQDRIGFENRANLLSTIFDLYHKGRLALPNVDKFFRKEDDGDRYVVSNPNVNKYPIRLKWSIYFKIVEIARDMAITYQDELAEELEEARKEHAEIRQTLDGYILKSADIIGMTTTGAAKMHGMLEIAKPEVVIVEEAAEILESHIVTSLTEDCKHLILIGDHLQLRPSANIFELWKKYRLNVSLFERMILNGIPLCSLKTQHRMRPEISNLLIGPIYDELHDHPKVHEYPPVKGIAKSLFFINHHELEQTDGDLLSKCNHHEAEFLVALCEYLLKQGYDHSQITILTTYTGQMFLLRKIFPESCRGVRITCVDNFQGEENDIILLSLVRSNEQDKVGFVAIDNRICVALSRARHGLYVIGNMDGMVVASKTWKKIQLKLKEKGNIGDALQLVCEQHKNVTEVKTGKDFVPLCDGGCDKKCQAKLHCSHVCPQLCHALDQGHKRFRCKERCAKTCESGHQCSGPCCSECPRCKILVSKTLPCGHQKTVACFQNVAAVQCSTPVPRKLFCGHDVEIECHVDVESVRCKVPIEIILPCGHVCLDKCYKTPDQIKCDVIEEKLLDCGHSKKLKCYSRGNRENCDVLVKKTLECGHKTEVQCWTPIQTVYCKVDVEKTLPCGHPHILKCSEEKHGIQCHRIIDLVLPECAHVRKLPCFRSIGARCRETCEKPLPCGHPCPSTCHVTEDPDHSDEERYVCRQKCNRSCESGHPCKNSHACFRKCLPCDKVVKLTLNCGHKLTTECCKAGTVKCWRKVKKELPCGHRDMVPCHVLPENHKCAFQIVKCEKKCSSDHPCSFDHACYEGCPPCEEPLRTTLPCNHEGDLPCHDDGEHHQCKEDVLKELPCGHSQNSECHMDPSLVTCKNMVPMTCWRCSSKVVVECDKTKLGICIECENACGHRARGRLMRASNNNTRALSPSARIQNLVPVGGGWGRGGGSGHTNSWRRISSHYEGHRFWCE